MPDTPRAGARGVLSWLWRMAGAEGRRRLMLSAQSLACASAERARPAPPPRAPRGSMSAVLTRRMVLPRLSDFPIPANVKAGGPGWCAQMIEMADHVGALATLTISDKLGGDFITIPADPSSGPFGRLVGPLKAAILSQVYRRERLLIPLGTQALKIARRGVVLAAVRAGKLTGNDGARILGIRRTHFSGLLNKTNEGLGIEVGELPLPRDLRLLNDAAEIAAGALLSAGATVATADQVMAEIVGLAA